MAIEITTLENENFDKRCSVKVGEYPEELIQNITDLLSSRFTEGSEMLLEQTLKRLQKYNSLSTELIRYYLLTEKTGSHSKTISFLYTNYGKHTVKEEMRKLYRFIKKKNIKIVLKSGYYKRLLNWSGNFKKFLVCRTVHTFKV
jgi:ribosomal protein L23